MIQKKDEKVNISKSLGKLEEIVNWFKGQEDVDVEAGLNRLKEATPILKNLKSRLKEVENEFKEIKQDLEENEDKEETEEIPSIEGSEGIPDVEDIPF